MVQKKSANNIQSRLEDAKRQYNYNQKLIKRLMKEIKETPLIVLNANKTESASPQLKIYQELIKTNLNLRKQIADNELIIQNGTIKNDESANPFE